MVHPIGRASVFLQPCSLTSPPARRPLRSPSAVRADWGTGMLLLAEGFTSVPQTLRRASFPGEGRALSTHTGHVPEPERTPLPARWASQVRDEFLGQGTGTLLRKPAEVVDSHPKEPSCLS